MIIKVSRYRSKPQRKAQASARPIKIRKTSTSQESLVETKSQPSLIVRQVRNVRPLTPADALFAWNSLFQTGVV